MVAAGIHQSSWQGRAGKKKSLLYRTKERQLNSSRLKITQPYRHSHGPKWSMFNLTYMCENTYNSTSVYSQFFGL